MSCFIVKNESILKIIKGFDQLKTDPQLKNYVLDVIDRINASYNNFISDIEKFSYKDYLNICCKQLKILNLQAYKNRYKENINELLKQNYNMDFSRLTLNNSLNITLSNNIYQYVKTLECFLYQCSEENIQKHDLYQALQNLVIKIKCWVFNKHQAYQNAEWE